MLLSLWGKKYTFKNYYSTESTFFQAAFGIKNI